MPPFLDSVMLQRALRPCYASKSSHANTSREMKPSIPLGFARGAVFFTGYQRIFLVGYLVLITDHKTEVWSIPKAQVPRQIYRAPLIVDQARNLGVLNVYFDFLYPKYIFITYDYGKSTHFWVRRT